MTYLEGSRHDGDTRRLGRGWRDRLHLLAEAEPAALLRVTQMAQQHFAVPISTLTILDGDRHAHVAAVGVEEGQLLDHVCPVAMQAEGVFVATDLVADARFTATPPVEGPPHLRFYAAVALHAPTGHPIGTFCIMDTVPRGFTRQQADDLLDLAQWAQRELDAFLAG